MSHSTAKFKPKKAQSGTKSIGRTFMMPLLKSSDNVLGLKRHQLVIQPILGQTNLRNHVLKHADHGRGRTSSDQYVKTTDLGQASQSHPGVDIVLVRWGACGGARPPPPDHTQKQSTKFNDRKRNRKFE